MPLSLFHHKRLWHHREVVGQRNEYGHTVGGDLPSFGIHCENLQSPPHLLYRLNLADPAIDMDLPGIQWLPLCYGFAYAAYEGTFIYKVLSDSEIRVIAPHDAEYDPNFPYENFPRSFSQQSLIFERQQYDPTVAEDALSLAAVFGVEQLSEAEMQRAIRIVEETSGLFREWGGPGTPGKDFPDWSREELVRYQYKEPFAQGPPSKSCENPDCTAEIEYHVDAHTIDLPEGVPLIGGETLKLDAYDVRRDSMRVIGLHQPGNDDTAFWGDPYVQLIFEFCGCCRCVRVTNQCT
jgi:hypothetical protein